MRLERYTALPKDGGGWTSVARECSVVRRALRLPHAVTGVAFPS